ncbi:MAG: type II 3-dehydroquinate dehydratase [Clostridia bacterium]|nr:type II 3-dehydroquinate dehydratase [Clostridia bacterium]
MNKYLIINGPNLNMLGIREPAVYGSRTYDDLCEYIRDFAKKINVEVDFFQSNSEGELVTEIQKTLGKYDGIVMNPGAYAHYSFAIHDAIKAVTTPCAEVHISDIHSREEFRRTSVTAPACCHMISGKGFDSYTIALEMLENDKNR